MKQIPEQTAANKNNMVRLSGDERKWVDGMIRTGKRSAQMLMTARVLLAADANSPGVDGLGLGDSSIVEALGTRRSSVGRAPEPLSRRARRRTLAQGAGAPLAPADLRRRGGRQLFTDENGPSFHDDEDEHGHPIWQDYEEALLDVDGSLADLKLYHDTCRAMIPRERKSCALLIGSHGTKERRPTRRQT